MHTFASTAISFVAFLHFPRFDSLISAAGIITEQWLHHLPTSRRLIFPSQTCPLFAVLFLYCPLVLFHHFCYHLLYKSFHPGFTRLPGLSWVIGAWRFTFKAVQNNLLCVWWVKSLRFILSWQSRVDLPSYLGIVWSCLTQGSEQGLGLGSRFLPLLTDQGCLRIDMWVGPSDD